MNIHWISIADIKQDGQKFILKDESFWQEVWQYNSWMGKILTSLQLKILVLPQTTGIYISGLIKGQVGEICARCAMDTVIDLEHTFEVFNIFEAEMVDDEESYLQAESGQWYINTIKLAAEQFFLSLPHKVLCSENCKGVCVVCGKDLNFEICNCSTKNNPFVGLSSIITKKN